MDGLLKNIQREIDADIRIAEEEINRRETDKTLTMGENLSKMFKEKGKKSLLEAPLFDIYVILCALLNTNCPYDEIEEKLRLIEHTINKWQRKDTTIMDSVLQAYNLLKEQSQEKFFVNSKDYEKCLCLGFNPTIFVYNIIPSFGAIKPVIEFREEVEKWNKKEYSFLFPKIIESIFNRSEIKIIATVIDDYVIEARNYKKKRKEVLKRAIEALKRFRKEVEKGILLEITEIPNYVKPYLSANTLEPIYYLFNLTLRKENIILDAQIKMYEKLLADPIIKLLYENNINPDLIDESKLDRLKNIPFALVEKAIKLISLLELPKIDLLNREENIIEAMDFDSFNTLIFFYENGIVTKKTFQNNFTILTSDAKKIITNYEILKSIMAFKSRYYDDSVLLSEPTSLKERLSVLAEYSLTTNDYIFLLCHYEYISIYDLILEQNIPRYLFIQICKTPNPIFTIKRICLYRILDIPYKTAENLLKKEVKEERFFICENSSLDNYLSLIDSSKEEGSYIGDIKKTSLVRMLDEEYCIEDIYCFNNTNVSRPKFLKYLQRIKDKGKDIEDYVQHCLLADSFVNERNILEIKKEVKKMASS